MERTDRTQPLELDTAKIDDAILALLLLGLHDGCRVWKGFDWESLERLHEQGYIAARAATPNR